MELNARLSLFGFVPTPARLSVTARTRSERVARALLTLLGTALAAPLVAIIPPHIEPVVMTVIAGLYWTRKHWVAEYVVAEFDGVCPRCLTPIDIKPRTTLRFPQNVACFKCHEHPFLELGDAPPVDPARLASPATAPPPSVGERRPLKIWSPAGSDW